MNTTWEGVYSAALSGTITAHYRWKVMAHYHLALLTVLYTPTATKSFVLCLANKEALGDSRFCKQRNSPQEEQPQTWHCCYDHSALWGFPLGPVRILATARAPALTPTPPSSCTIFQFSLFPYLPCPFPL